MLNRFDPESGTANTWFHHVPSLPSATSCRMEKNTTVGVLPSTHFLGPRLALLIVHVQGPFLKAKSQFELECFQTVLCEHVCFHK